MDSQAEVYDIVYMTNCLWRLWLRRWGSRLGWTVHEEQILEAHFMPCITGTGFVVALKCILS